jgi:hypothetical protein
LNTFLRINFGMRYTVRCLCYTPVPTSHIPWAVLRFLISKSRPIPKYPRFAPNFNVLDNYYENGRVRTQLFWLKILLLEGRHVSAPLLGHHQVTKNILRGNYVGGRVTVRVINSKKRWHSCTVFY